LSGVRGIGAGESVYCKHRLDQQRRRRRLASSQARKCILENECIEQKREAQLNCAAAAIAAAFAAAASGCKQQSKPLLRLSSVFL
jgi:hypothetical protein